MIRTARLIFCDNEHGMGDVCFPDVYGQSGPELTANFLESKTAQELRKAARKEGWGVINGADYCPGCMECM